MEAAIVICVSVFVKVQYRYVANFLVSVHQREWSSGGAAVMATWSCHCTLRMLTKVLAKWTNITPSNYRSIVEREILFLIISLCENYMKVCGLLYTIFHNYLFSLVGICPLIHILPPMSLCDCIIFVLCSNALARNLHVDQNSVNLQTIRDSLNLTTCLCTENALVGSQYAHFGKLMEPSCWVLNHGFFQLIYSWRGFHAF